MVVQRVAHNAQRQRLTVTLKNICRDYPAGGGVLRELLQNADDAGAKYVTFLLDEGTYPATPLQDPCLAESQGPALLAYNSAVFKETDWESLSHLGESLKDKDGSTTGKFGRGFNTVYNYTDSPSILSGNEFTILDPHQEWSEGGDRFNFVEGAADPGIKNHMAAFQRILTNPDKAFDGTIIRIPLRTKKQAIKSDISDKATTVHDVRKVLEQFAEEFGKNGLLFMKNVESITIKSTSDLSIKISVLDSAGVREHRLKVNEAVKRHLKNSVLSFEHSFAIGLSLTQGNRKPNITKFQVYHSMRGDLMSIKMREWAHGEKLVPWVAVASRIDCSIEFKGSLFTVLPLPISINQPVHIHGLFSLAPDRARLLTLEDKTIQDKNPAEWNEWLLRTSIPIAWAKVLGSLASSQHSAHIFNAWPRKSNSSDPLFLNTLADVVEVIRKEKLRVWPTKDGYVSETNCLMPAETKVQLQDAIYAAVGQIVFAPSRLISSIQTLFGCNGANQIVERKIIPKWSEAGAAEWSKDCSIQLAQFVLTQFPTLGDHSRATLRNIPLVPVINISGEETSKFVSAAQLIDPTNQELVNFFFAQEEVLPQRAIFKQFSTELRKCGLKTKLDQDLLYSRIRYYSNWKQLLLPLSALQQKIVKLLGTSLGAIDFSSQSSSSSELRTLPWIPVRENGITKFKPPNQCRGYCDRLIVGSQMPIYENTPASDWSALLGWNEPISRDVLLSQLKHGVGKSDRNIVDAVLKYINSSTSNNEDLKGIPFVYTSNQSFVLPKNAFSPPEAQSPSCASLGPYYANVETKFWNDHLSLLKLLNIREGPTADDLITLLDKLHVRYGQLKRPLSESDLEIAVEVLRLASQLSLTSESIRRLKVPNTSRYLYAIEGIIYKDLPKIPATGPPELTHPSIPSSTAELLHIQPLSRWARKIMLNCKEFDQHEETTARIADTLERYSIDSTFREYLANADDTNSATKISWLLDNRTHATGNLITEELKEYQGPALLVYNDGVFKEQDLKGFQNVGEGSKGQDRTTIGRFGRGSQTMYHWADVPMVISGKYFLILDPQRQCLPEKDFSTERMAGVQLQLSNAKDLPNQLAPFDGLWGYDKNLEYYPGTIFRFPLRQGKSSLTPTTGDATVTAKMVSEKLNHYFTEARTSLLFLKNIHEIEFKVYGDDNNQWSVNKLPRDEDSADDFAKIELYSYSRKFSSGHYISGKDKWLVAIEDIQESINHLSFNPMKRRLMKLVECGISCLLSTSTTNRSSSHATPPSIPRPRIFSHLQLPTVSNLPVHIHATFALTGDRKSINLNAVGEDTQEVADSQWNKYLLRESLPDLYLAFLEDLARRVRHNVFQFWPRQELVKGTCSELVSTNFWKKVPSCSRNLFPESGIAPVIGRQKPPKVFPLEKAVFDFLPKSDSAAIAPLLLSLDQNLVKDVPEDVSELLKGLTIQTVSGSFLGTILKSESMAKKIHGDLKGSALEVLLRLVVPTVDSHFQQLHGCHILPLANGTFSQLTLRNSEETTQYFMTSEEEAELFAVASNFFVLPSMQKLFVDLLKSETFNIAKIEIQDIGKLLEKRDVPKTVDQDTDEWLIRFWLYWNKKTSKASSADDINMDSLGPVFKSTRDGIAEYKLRSELDALPAVVQPSEPKHLELASHIPGLFMFDQLRMTTQLKKSEITLSKEPSILRLLKSIRLLATQSSFGDMGSFLTSYLGNDELKLLRDLIANHCTSGKSAVLEYIADLRSVPFWENWDDSDLLPATAALKAEDPNLLVPWMKESTLFVVPSVVQDRKYKHFLQALEVEEILTEDLIASYVLPIPHLGTDIYWEKYRKFLSVALPLCWEGKKYSEKIRRALSRGLTAPDEKRILHKPKHMYDHENEIFASAFRNTGSDKFIHKDVQQLRSSFFQVGLCYRQDGVFEPDDYKECINAMSQRLLSTTSSTDAKLWGDADVVLSPLTTPSSATYKFNPWDWVTIAHIKVFKSRQVLSKEPSHRRNKMEHNATTYPLLCLSEILLYKHAAVCWSQTSFAISEPTSEVLCKSSSNKGEPSLEMVWMHLQHLRDMASNLRLDQLDNFLLDLHLTYEYLQSNIDKNIGSFQLRARKLWLNLTSAPGETATLADVQNCWVAIEDLVLLSACDSGPTQAVKPSLMRYDKLLRTLGCKSIIHPYFAPPELSSRRDPSANFREMRQNGVMLDIAYTTEGQTIHAHRLVLAGAFKKCKAQFGGGFRVEDHIRFDEDTEPLGFISYHTLSAMINDAYGDEVDWNSMQAIEGEDLDTTNEKLNLLLDFLKGADYWINDDLKKRIEYKIIESQKLFINIENVRRVKERAEEANAEDVNKMCSAFIDKNKESVERATPME